MQGTDAGNDETVQLFLMKMKYRNCTQNFFQLVFKERRL